MGCLKGCMFSRDVLTAASWDAFAKDALDVDLDSKPTLDDGARAGTKRARARKRLAVGEALGDENESKQTNLDAREAANERTEGSLRAMESAMDGNLLFVELDARARRRVMDAMTPSYVDEGEIVIAQGDTNCDRFYVIEIGEVRVMKNENSKRSSLSNDSANEEGSPRAARLATSKRSFEGCAYHPETAKQVATLGPGRGFGELALLYACPRSATVVAATPLKLWTLHASAHLELKIHRDQRILKFQVHQNLMLKDDCQTDQFQFQYQHLNLIQMKEKH